MYSFLNSRNLPLYCAVGLGSIHLTSAFSMSMMRVYYGAIQKNNDFFKSDDFHRVSRCQLNIAEYSGALIALLLLVQSSGGDLCTNK